VRVGAKNVILWVPKMSSGLVEQVLPTLVAPQTMWKISLAWKVPPENSPCEVVSGVFVGSPQTELTDQPTRCETDSINCEDVAVRKVCNVGRGGVPTGGLLPVLHPVFRPCRVIHASESTRSPTGSAKE
jgi:hypothetical protein